MTTSSAARVWPRGRTRPRHFDVRVGSDSTNDERPIASRSPMPRTGQNLCASRHNSLSGTRTRSLARSDVVGNEALVTVRERDGMTARRLPCKLACRLSIRGGFATLSLVACLATCAGATVNPYPAQPQGSPFPDNQPPTNPPLPPGAAADDSPTIGKTPPVPTTTGSPPSVQVADALGVRIERERGRVCHLPALCPDAAVHAGGRPGDAEWIRLPRQRPNRAPTDRPVVPRRLQQGRRGRA